MFVYCLWSGDKYEHRCILLSHQTICTQDEFTELCDNIKNELINKTSKNHEIMDTIDGVKSIWEYSIDDDMLNEILAILIKKHGFKKLTDFPVYHVKGVDPYDYD